MATKKYRPRHGNVTLKCVGKQIKVNKTHMIEVTGIQTFLIKSYFTGSRLNYGELYLSGHRQFSDIETWEELGQDALPVPRSRFKTKTHIQP